MLSDELESKPELLVQFVQNTSIPLGQGLVESEAKDITCLSLLPVTEASECSRLMLPDDTTNHSNSSKEVPSSAVLRSLRVNVGPDGEETRAQTVQKSPELAHDSLIAATRAQLAKNAKTSSNGENVHLGSGDGQSKDSGPLPQVEKKLKCTVEGCDRTFVWPAHFKYHLKTHRRLWEKLLCAAEAEGAHEDPQWREALYVP
uniref:cDNA FLJ52844, moderately similar to Zinc finger protein 410 n=1 Tax=Homo sapiens TaxID=9606 RepID=B4E382_HUMAN|nr:unnamed protein product [Homo sapiens]